MRKKVKRRIIIGGTFLLVGLTIRWLRGSKRNQSIQCQSQRLARNFKILEKKYGTTLGIYAIDPESGLEVSYHSRERFAFMATYKSLLGGIILKAYSNAELHKRIYYVQSDLVECSKITAQHLCDGMTVKELIYAAIVHDDNTAGNLLLSEIGGPRGFVNELRKLGAGSTYAERYELEINEVYPGDKWDTTTPEAFGSVFEILVSGDNFQQTSYDYFIQLLKENTDQNSLIRKSIPYNYEVGEQIGSGSYGVINVLSFITPKDSDKIPMVWAVYSKKAEENSKPSKELITQVASVLSEFYTL